MKEISAESGLESSNRYQQLAEDYLNLLHALPHPTAVFRAADGCLVAANHHFCTIFKLPLEAAAKGWIAGFSDIRSELNSSGVSSGSLHIHAINDGAIQFETAGGRRLLVETDALPCRYGGQDCWIVTTGTVDGQNPFRNGPIEPSPQQAAGNALTIAVQEETRYRALVENLNDIVYTTDAEAMVTYISPNIFQMSGYEPAEVIGKCFTAFVHPEDLPGRIEQFLRTLDGRNEATEYRLFTKTGETKWARTSARPIRRNGRVVGVQGILVDITDRKTIEEALIRSEEKYRILVQHAKDAIFVVQGEHIKFMNPIASEILGYTCDCIADRPFIDFIHPDDRTSILDRYHRRLRGEDLSSRVSFRVINKDGDTRDVDLNAVLISWEEKPAILNFLRDITLQKMMEEQLRNSQRMEALGTLAGGIAHNFNNLLMGILGNTSLSLNGLDPSAPACRYLDKINKLVQGGSKLTHQLLEYARGGSCQVGSVNLNQLVKDASETLLATRKQIRIHHTLAENIPCLIADQGQIEQVLLNLLLNAADAMPNGGDVIIETSCLAVGKAKEIAELSPKKEYVLLKVSDCGTGIPKAILDRIFEPFFTTKGFERGTGLGLSTAYGIVKNHDGEISVKSKVNKGTSFLIYLPASAGGSSQPVVDNISKQAADDGPKSK